MGMESGICHRRGLGRWLPRRCARRDPCAEADPVVLWGWACWTMVWSSGPPFTSTWPLPSDFLKALFPVCDRKWLSSHLAGPTWGPVRQQTESLHVLTLCRAHGRCSRILRVSTQDRTTLSVPPPRALSAPGLAGCSGSAGRCRCKDLQQGRNA